MSWFSPGKTAQEWGGGLDSMVGGMFGAPPKPPNFAQAGMQGPLGGAFGTMAGQYAAQAGQPYGQGRDQAINAAYGQATSRLDPQWQQRQTGMDSQLANQGLDPTSQAAQAMRGQFGRDRNDAYAQAMYNAQTGAGNAAFGQELQQRQGMLQGLLGIQGQGLQGMGLQNNANMGWWDARQKQMTDQVNGTMAAGTAAAKLPFQALGMFGGG